MEFAQHLDALRRDADGLLAAAPAADPQERIESCPEWTPLDLVRHVSDVWHFFTSCVRDSWDDPSAYERPPRPDDDEVSSVAAANADELMTVLAAADPATPRWSWSGHGDVAWVARRMAQETAVHRFDADRAAGRDHRIDAELAADGIDEFLFDFLPVAAARGLSSLDGSAHLHCTDVAGEWIVEPAADGGYEIRRAHEKGDVAVRGAASDLLLVIWRRLPLEAVDIVGDRHIAEQLTVRTV